MPWLTDAFASHQWLRELKRRGQRTLLAVDFRLPPDEPVWVGRYHQEHQAMGLGRAIGMLIREVDSRGFEVLVPRSIRPAEILRIRTPSQILGWRYSPDAHGSRPTCACRVCLPKGMIKSRRLRQRLDPTGEFY